MKAGAIVLALCTILLSAAPALAHCHDGWGGYGHGWHGYGWNNYGWNNRWNNYGWNRWNNYRWNNWNPNAYYGGWHRYWNGYPGGYRYWQAYNPGCHAGWYTHNRPWY